MVTSDRARRSSGVETNKANDRADGKCDSGATREIAAHVSAKCQAADSQSDESHGLAEDGSGAIPPCCGGAARRLTQVSRVEFHKHGINSALPGPRSRPCHARVRHGDRRLVHRVAAWRSPAARASTHAGPLTGRGDLATTVTDDLYVASQRSAATARREIRERPSEQPREQTQGSRRARSCGRDEQAACRHLTTVPTKEDHMAVMAERSTGDTTVRPFTIEIPEADLDDLRARIAATRWPSKELVADRSQGVQLATMQELARYWTEDYDFGRIEARLNALPQFTTEIDDVEIHFIHVRSKHEDAMPLIMTHGWPGSVIELLDTVGPLTDPTAHGGERRGRIPPRRCRPYPATASRASRPSSAGTPTASHARGRS